MVAERKESYKNIFEKFEIRLLHWKAFIITRQAKLTESKFS